MRIRFLTAFGAVLLFEDFLHAETPPAVPDLVKQLGDPKFAVREAAQKELLKRGEGIAPDLEKLAKTTDPETADRLRKILYELVGYKQTILRLLTEMEEGNPPISNELLGLVASHQPGAGELLNSIYSADIYPLKIRVPALRTFIAAWDHLTSDQIEDYLKKNITVFSVHRPKFPAKVGAMISFQTQIRDGWTGWPHYDKKIDFRTRTTRYLDSKPYEEPFVYQYPFATVGWIRLGELAQGKHTIHAIMEYEFTHRGQKRKGEIRSKDSQFEIVPADVPDDLVAPRTAEHTAKLRKAFSIRDKETEANDAAKKWGMGGPDSGELWRHQISWNDKQDNWYALTCAVWNLSETLPFDLCYEVEIQDVKTGKIHAADSLLVAGNREAGGYFSPRDARAFAKDREGFVTVKILLKPSRALALTNPKIECYYPEPITSGEVRMKVTTPATRHAEGTSGIKSK